MHKHFLVLINVIFFSHVCFSQVDVQTGTAQFSLPIYNYTDAKSGLSHSVAVNYTSGSGLRVNELPGGVGQGWALLAGGSIMRKQNGEPDDQSSIAAFPTGNYNTIYGYTDKIGLMCDPGNPGWVTPAQYVNDYYPNGFLYSEFPLDLTDDYPLKYAAPKESAFIPRFQSSEDKRWKQSRRTLADRQQDVFIFNINGRVGQFVIPKVGDITTLGFSKLKIEKVETDMTPYRIRTRISEFKITDESGIIYRFNALSLSEVLKPIEISTVDGDIIYTVSGEDATGDYTVDQWGLTEIINPFTNEKIVLNYIDNNVDYESQQIPSYQVMDKQSVNLSKIRAKGDAKILSGIIFPDGHSISIHYDPSSRQDIQSEPRMADVSVSYNNALIAKYVFTHGYLLKKEVKNYTDVIATADKRFARLCLTSIQKQGADGTSEPPFQFAYHTGMESTDPKDIVPSTDCFATDHWGYYNKSAIVDINIPTPTAETFKSLMVNASIYRTASSGTPKFGLLKTIKNSAGGEITYDYEQNIQNGILIGGVHVNSLKLYDGNDHTKDVVTNYSYTNSDGSSSIWGYEEPVYNISRELKFVKYPGHYDYGGNQIANVTTSISPLTEVKNVVISYAKSYLISGAIKIVSQYLGAAASVTGPPGLFVWGMVAVLTKIAGAIILLADPFDYYQNNSYQFYPMNYNNPIGIHFSRVVISNTSLAGGTGKIIQEYSKPVNMATEILSNNFPYSEKQRYGSWMYDQLTKQSVFDNTDRLLNETNNTYTSYASKIGAIPAQNTTSFLSCKVEPNHLFSSHCFDAMDQISVSNWTGDFYYPLTGASYLTNTITKNYSNTGVLSETSTTADYEEINMLQKSTTNTKSNDDQVITKTYYAIDYNSSVSPAIALLKTNNANAIPVSTEIWLKKAATNAEFLIGASINEYIVLPNNDVKIGKIYSLESKEPVAKSTILDWDANTLIRNTNYFKVQQEFSYNADGNLSETISSGGQVSASIFDYKKRLLTASVSNARVSDVAYSSFEAENTGGWIYTPAGIMSNGFTPTGVNYYTLANGSITTAISINSDYTLSFWAKDSYGPVSISGSPILVKQVALNDWTYYQYKIPQGSASPTLSGNGAVDELRLYPSIAKMSTTSYDPTKGKTTECDINNRISYYNYDGLGRLQTVKDEKGNVTKTYEYNFKIN